MIVEQLEFINNLRWQDGIDLLILSAVIYKIILMLQGTRTVQIMIGFLLVSVISYGADFFGIAGVSWVLKNIFNSIVIVVIVLFQADFRNALAQMGTRYFFRDMRRDNTEGLIGKLYDVCEHFSKNRIGALIVLENEMGLGHYNVGATRLNALFSPQLLAALFNPNAPLHDGAVIINRDGLVSHAGCILPLSSNIDLSKKLGTRHRAALGLSQESDALILVVSEETGKISVAYNGELFRGNHEETVKSRFFNLAKKS